MSLLSTDAYRQLPVAQADARISYGALDVQFGDLYLPAGLNDDTLSPCVILVHGGCWQAEYPLDGIAGAARRLSDEGWIVWSIEYRALGSGGGWPETFLDVGAAFDFVRDLASEYAIDLDHIAAVGHSAGGHLAAWAAGRHNLDPVSRVYFQDPLPISALLSLAGLVDLDLAITLGLCGDAPERLIHAAKSTQDRKDSSVVNLTPLSVPQVHLVGRQDPYVPESYVRAVARDAQEKGEDVQLEVLENCGHFEVAVPTGPAFDSVIAALRRLLDPN
jgi:acetyl esterase/lipase